jgi:hypothetical protein
VLIPSMQPSYSPSWAKHPPSVICALTCGLNNWRGFRIAGGPDMAVYPLKCTGWAPSLAQSFAQLFAGTTTSGVASCSCW